MSSFFKPNINFYGRMVRGVIGVNLLILGIVLADVTLWACLPLVAGGLFALFEALRGWCLARACGVRTRL
jgi:hypothetical protein